MRTTWILLFVLADGPKFYPDDPILVDRDDLRIEEPGEIELSPTYDVLYHSFARGGVEGAVPRAANVNTLGEVPDSSWFTNRIGVRELSLDELARGPSGEPPDESRPFTIVAAKESGITPGFTVRDARGNVYFVKFDPREHENLSTGADVISKNFFHAIGYNVPQSHILYPRSEDFLIDEGAQIRLEGGDSVPLEREFIDRMLETAAHRPDGTIRAIFSLAVPGKPLGPFAFEGTRPDDPNDVFPHEDRRELRGYRVFCAWLNHDDSRAINTLDAYVPEGYVRHYLIDFGSTLGSGSDKARNIAPQDPRSGNEYIVDFDFIWKAAWSFGIADRAWRKFRYAYPRYAEAGRIEGDSFEPDRWKPEYPNPAFDRMLADDAFWAAKIVARFSDEAIRRITATGDFTSVDVSAHLAEVVMKRRDKVVAHYFRQLAPLDGFGVAEDLTFRNLGEERGLGVVDTYRYEWFAFDNETGESAPLAEGESPAPRIPIPESSSEYLRVRIRSLSRTEPNWRHAVDVYVRGSRVVGIDRAIGPALEEHDEKGESGEGKDEEEHHRAKQR
jgi:hypothetical protein